MLFCPAKYNKTFENVNDELFKIEGELTDDEAKIFLYKLLRANLGFTAELISGWKLAAYQEIILKGWFNRNFSMMVAGRGCGKSTLAALFCCLYPIFYPATKILLAGPTFRTSRNIFNEVEKIVNGKEATLLKQAFSKDPHHRTDICFWDINDGSITAIPLNGEKIRGFRATVLILDEFLLLNKDIVEKVLMPFLVANDNIKERLVAIEREDELIKIGAMKEEERTVFKNNTKMICLSSASYTFQYLYEKFKQWSQTIYDENSKEDATYFITQIGYEGIPDAMISKTIIEEAEAGGLSNPNFRREYLAEFINDNDGYFSAKKMKECTLEPGETPHLTLAGNKDKKFIVSIDPNFNNSQTADHFAMCVMEYNPDTGFGTVIHQYANSEADLKANVDYFYYLLTHFNVIFVILDFAGGEKFIQACNLSEHFQKAKIKLKFIEFDSLIEGPEQVEELKKARNQYNQSDWKICLEQHFSTEWIRKANEYLQSNINYKRVFFGSKITPDGSIFDSVISQEVDTSLMGFKGGSQASMKLEAINEQDYLIDLVKTECALIEVKTTSQGTQSFDLPQHLRRDKSADKARKDSYTALKLGNWACKCYYDIMSYKPSQTQTTFTPQFIG